MDRKRLRWFQFSNVVYLVFFGTSERNDLLFQSLSSCASLYLGEKRVIWRLAHVYALIIRKSIVSRQYLKATHALPLPCFQQQHYSRTQVAY